MNFPIFWSYLEHWDLELQELYSLIDLPQLRMALQLVPHIRLLRLQMGELLLLYSVLALTVPLAFRELYEILVLVDHARWSHGHLHFAKKPRGFRTAFCERFNLFLKQEIAEVFQNYVLALDEFVNVFIRLLYAVHKKNAAFLSTDKLSSDSNLPISVPDRNLRRSRRLISFHKTSFVITPCKILHSNNIIKFLIIFKKKSPSLKKKKHTFGDAPSPIKIAFAHVVLPEPFGPTKRLSPCPGSRTASS